MEYNLLHEPAIYALYENGETKEISILEIFEDLTSIKSIFGDIKIQEFPLTRLLITIVYRAYKDKIYTPDEWTDLWYDGIEYNFIEQYLKKYENRFDLLSDETPFYQVADSVGKYEDSKKNADNRPLLLDNQRAFYNSSTEWLFFSNSTHKGFENIGFSEAFRALITLQDYNTASRKSILKYDPRVSKRTYAQIGWAGNFSGVLLIGDNLQETLLLNLVPYGSIRAGDLSPSHDFAVWEKPQQDQNPANDFWKNDPLDSYGIAKGICELMTFQSSRVSLKINDDNAGINKSVVGIGDRIFVYDQFAETMAAHRGIEREGGIPARIPVLLNKGSGSAWENVNALLSFYDSDQKNKYESPNNIYFFKEHILGTYDSSIVNVKVFSVKYGAQNAVIDDWNISTLDISRDAFNNSHVANTLIRAADLPSQIVYCIDTLYKGILQASGRTSLPSDKSIKDAVMSRFEDEYYSFASTITEDNIPEKQQEWLDLSKTIALDFKDQLTQSISSKAMQGKRIGDKKLFTIFHALNKFDIILQKKLKEAFNG